MLARLVQNQLWWFLNTASLLNNPTLIMIITIALYHDATMCSAGSLLPSHLRRLCWGEQHRHLGIQATYVMVMITVTLHKDQTVCSARSVSLMSIMFMLRSTSLLLGRMNCLFKGLGHRRLIVWSALDDPLVCVRLLNDLVVIKFSPTGMRWRRWQNNQ
jgi:hypothetical protein